MMIYICSVILCLIGVVLQLNGTVAPDSFHVFYILGGILFVISVIVQGTMYSNQCIVIEKITESKENKEIYEEKDRILIGECKEYLKEAYPNIEKEIFSNMASAKALLLNFPEINSHKTIMKLVSMINFNKDCIYNAAIAITGFEREIRARKRIAHFWVYSPMIPNLPKNME